MLVSYLVALLLSLSLVNCTSDESQVKDPVTESSEGPPSPGAQFSQEELASKTVYFDFDKHNIKSEYQAALNDVAEKLRVNSNVMLQIEGHCDERGTIEYNLALGERRAQSVKQYLVNLGLDGSRVTTVSFGEEKPSVDQHDRYAWSKNRRAVLVVAPN